MKKTLFVLSTLRPCFSACDQEAEGNAQTRASLRQATTWCRYPTHR